MPRGEADVDVLPIQKCSYFNQQNISHKNK